jgi:hypothetical protein
MSRIISMTIYSPSGEEIHCRRSENLLIPRVGEKLRTTVWDTEDDGIDIGDTVVVSDVEHEFRERPNLSNNERFVYIHTEEVEEK